MKKIIILFNFAMLIFFTNCESVKKISKGNEYTRVSDPTIFMKGYQPIDPIQIGIKKRLLEIGKDTILFTFNEKWDSVSSKRLDKYMESLYKTVASKQLDLKPVLKKLPNEATRIAIGKINNRGSLTFGLASIGTQGENYTVVVDYIKYITTKLPAMYDEQIDGTIIYRRLKTNYGEKQTREELYEMEEERTSKTTKIEITEDSKKKQTVSHEISIPIYIGVGLRIQAEIKILKDSVNLGNFYNLGIAASQNQLTGTIIIQTLGISGENISPLLPIPNQINESTIQNAMQALATIKSNIYDEQTLIRPQVLGFSLIYSIEGARDLIETSLYNNPPLLYIRPNDELEFEERVLIEEKEY